MKIIKKYEMFLKYIVVALFSFLVDITLFTIFNYLTKKIVLATIMARVISSFINYLLNRDKVFKKENKTSIYKYYLLVVIQMFISAYGVNNLYKIIHINPTLIKIPVKFIIFICNYLIQKIFIFKRGKDENN